MSDGATIENQPGATRDNAITLIGGVFDAAMTEPHWRKFLVRLGDVLKAYGLQLLIQEVGREVFRARAPEGFEPIHDGPQQERIRLRIDLSRGLASDTLRVTGDDDAVDGWKSVMGDDDEAASLSKSPTFVIGCFVSKHESAACLIGVRWRSEAAPNEPSDGFLRSFVPQLQRAFSLHRQFAQLRMRQHAISDVIDWLPFAVLFVDAGCQVVAKNRKAAALAEERDGMMIERSILVANGSTETARLRELVRHAAASTESPVATEAMTLERPSMRQPLTVMVSSLSPAESADGGGTPLAVVFISDPAETYDIAEETVLHFFDLTPAEARLLAGLANGNSLGEVAERHDVTVNTLKTQLNNIFRKTGTNRQSELIKLVYSTPVVMNAFASTTRSTKNPGIATD